MSTLSRVLLVVLSLIASSLGAQTIQFSSPRGVIMDSKSGHKPKAEVVEGIVPLVPLVELKDDSMVVVMANANAPEDSRFTILRTVVVQKSVSTLTSVVSQVSEDGTRVTTMLFTLDVDNKVLYISIHKAVQGLASAAASYVCNAVSVIEAPKSDTEPKEKVSPTRSINN